MFADALFCFSSVIPRQLSKIALSTMADEDFHGTSSVKGNRENKLIIAIYHNEYNSLFDNQRKTTYFSVLGATVHWTANGYASSDLHFYLFVAKMIVCIYQHIRNGYLFNVFTDICANICFASMYKDVLKRTFLYGTDLCLTLSTSKMTQIMTLS